MKKITVSIFALSALVMVSCGGEKEEKENVTTENHEEVVEVAKVSGVYNVNEGSVINWNGRHYKDSSFVHSGTVAITGGSVVVEEEAVVGGEFKFDMDAIVEPGTDTTQPWTLEGHFKMPDIFNVAEFASASFAITNVAEGNVTGDMTIIGVTKEVTFPAEIVINEENVNVSASFELDLLQFEVPMLVKGDALPEEEKQESAYPLAKIEFELSADKTAI